MENASKALLIAGAILIAILLIAVAMYIYTQSTQSFNTAVGKMSQQDRDMYNSSVEPYLGEAVRGSAVKTLIDQVKGSNDGNIGQSGKFISILVADKDDTGKPNCTPIEIKDKVAKLTGYNNRDDKAATALFDACKAANFYDDGENNSANVNAAGAQMDILRGKINSSKNYVVKADKEQGIIIRVHIAQVDD